MRFLPLLFLLIACQEPKPRFTDTGIRAQEQIAYKQIRFGISRDVYTAIAPAVDTLAANLYMLVPIFDDTGRLCKLTLSGTRYYTSFGELRDDYGRLLQLLKTQYGIPWESGWELTEKHLGKQGLAVQFCQWNTGRKTVDLCIGSAPDQEGHYLFCDIRDLDRWMNQFQREHLRRGDSMRRAHRPKP